MLITTRAIVLKAIRHGDSKVVLKAWTTHAGLRSYVVRAGGKRGSAMAALQALNRLELVVQEHAERDLHTVRELRVAQPYTGIPVDPVRGSVALFVQEVLYKVLRQESADEGLNAFIDQALEVLDTAPDLRYFPLVFLLQLSGHLGFFPEPPAQGEDRFDLREGHFVQGFGEHAHTLGPQLSKALAELLEVDLGAAPASAMPAGQRRELLEQLMLYFRMHQEGFGELRSPAVLHQLLG
jgi:DNA repair protein RecO (recombination protein O)